jgi:hypothetical protein
MAVTSAEVERQDWLGHASIEHTVVNMTMTSAEVNQTQ